MQADEPTASQAPRHRANRGRVRLFRAGLAAGAVALGFQAYLLGHGPDLGLGGFARAICTAVSAHGTAVLVAFGVLVHCAWCFRRLWLERLATAPGRVEVPVFTAGSELTDADRTQLTALFRQRLATLRLQSPAPVPGSAAPGDFLEVLSSNGAASGGVIGPLLAVLRSAKPTHAWEVHGTLVRRAQAPCCGVTVQVVRLPDQGAPPDTVYDVTWERAIRRAADRATAHILPHTERCGSPWATWQGFVMPPSLVEDYEDAVDLETRRRYDQAMARYYDVLRQDPMNLPVRLQVGQLQEKLGLHLDAFATYQGILDVGRPASLAFRPAAERERREARLVAAYRRVVLLGGPALGRQWYREPCRPPTERDEQRRSVRERLAIELADELPAAGPLLQEPDGRLSRRERERLRRELRALLADYALHQLPQVHACLGDLRDCAGPQARPPLSELSLALTRRCIEERLEWLRCPPGTGWMWTDDRITQLLAAASVDMNCWHEHYNAACLIALPLLVADGGTPEQRDQLARHAVAHLERAVACADSGYIATRRDWLLAEDPDFDGLRRHPRFKAFEAHYLPAGRPTPRRPERVQRLETARYTQDLVAASAQRCRALWQARRSEPPVTAWWQAEQRAWQAIDRLAVHHRHWRSRLDLVATMGALDGAQLEVAFRRYDESPLASASDEHRVDALAKAELAASDARLATLAGRIDARLDDAIDGWIERLRGDAPPGPTELAAVLDRHVAVWERLGEWFCAPQRDAERASERFGRELAQLLRLLGTPVVSSADEPDRRHRGDRARGDLPRAAARALGA